MTPIIQLSALDLVVATGFVLVLAAISWLLHLGLFKQIIIASIRTFVQLLFLGYILTFIFAASKFIWIFLIMLLMLIVASREAVRRPKYRFTGLWGMTFGSVSMFLTSFTLTFFTLVFIIQNDPWYQPQYSIPVLGMVLGNTMNGISLGMDRLTNGAWSKRPIIENRLMLGETAGQAIRDIRHDSIRAAMIPILNAMTVAGIVSLPGMMTGQILAGNAPMDAIKYQILIFFLILSSIGLATIAAVHWASHRLFDDRQRLRLDRLKK